MHKSQQRMCRREQGAPVEGYEQRQRVDLPQIQAQVTEYQAQGIRCPRCLHVTRGTFPDEIRGSVQYGPTVKGIALYLLYGQLLPYARTAEFLSDLCGCHLSPGTLEAFVAEGAGRLLETEEQICEQQKCWELMRQACESRGSCIGCMWPGPTDSPIMRSIASVARLPLIRSASSLNFMGRWNMTVTAVIPNIANVSMLCAMLILFENCAFSTNTRSSRGQSNSKSICLSATPL